MITIKIHNHDAHLKFHSIFDYMSIENNEMINKITEKIHDLILFLSERFHYEIITRISFIRVSSRKI